MNVHLSLIISVVGRLVADYVMCTVSSRVSAVISHLRLMYVPEAGTPEFTVLLNARL